VSEHTRDPVPEVLHAATNLPPDYRLRSEEAQRVLRGESPPPVELLVSLGAPLDLEDGIVRCPKCGLDSVQIVQATSFPSVSFPTSAAIFLRCRMCPEGDFAIGVDQEDGQAFLRTTRPR
jgi:hypothetical protein